MRRYSGFIIVVLIVAAAFAPVDVPFTLESVAKALPVRQWVLFKGLDGSLSSTLLDHRTGLAKDAQSYQLDRGDFVEIKFNDAWQSGDMVKTGEAVATIASNKLGERLVLLRNQLAIEQANLNVVATGQKQQTIKQLEEEINLAKEDLKLRKKTLDRAKGLYKEGLIALVELEQAENAYDQSAASVKVFEEALSVGATGEKKELLSLSQSKIGSLKKEISFFENIQEKMTITAPFDGAMRFEAATDGDRFFLEDTSETMFVIPVKLRDAKFLKPGQSIEIQLIDSEILISCSVLDLGTKVEILGREQVIAVRALTKAKKLPSGIPLRCRIQCGEVRVMEFLKRSVKWQ